LTSDGRLEFNPADICHEQHRQQIHQLCTTGTAPIFVLRGLLGWGEEERWAIFQLIIGIPGARVQTAENLDATDLFKAALASMVGDSDVQRRGRGYRAAIQAAALVHAGDVESAASRIIERLRELDLRGFRVDTIRGEIRKLVTSLQRIQNPEQTRQLRVCEVLPDAPFPPPAIVPMADQFEGATTEPAITGVDAIVPTGWQLDPAGISRLEDEGARKIMPVPVVIVRRLLDIYGGSESVEIAWPRDDLWKTRIVNRTTIAAPRTIIELASDGLPVTSNNAADLIQYLHDFEAQNIEVLPVGRVTRRLGWAGTHGSEGFLWRHVLLKNDAGAGHGAQDIAFVGAASGDEQIAGGFYAAGTFENWRRAIAPLEDYPRVEFCMYAALSPPLLEILCAENFIVSLAGPTSQGKTTVLRACASHWGCPSETAAATVLRTWDAPRYFLGEAAAVQSDLPLYVDDTKRARKPEIIPTVLYDISSGLGRGRGSPTGLRESRTWRTVMLTTGEDPITSFSQDGGIRARVIEFWNSPFGRANEITGQIVNAVNVGVRENFGHAGPQFVRFLIQHRDRWEGWKLHYHGVCERLQRRAGDDPVARRLAQHLALIRMAEILASAAGIFPWRSRNVVRALWPELVAEAPEADRAAAGLRYVFDWAHSNAADFFGCRADAQNPPLHGWAGRWDAGPRGHEPWSWIGFYQHRLEEVLTEGGFNAKSVIRMWHDRHWLRVDRDGRHQYRTQVAGSSTRLIAIERAAIIEVTGVADERAVIELTRPIIPAGRENGNAVGSQSGRS
jgi:hypothetical protein